MAVILLLKAYRAPLRPYKRTELWIILAKRDRPLFWKTSAPWPARPERPDHWVAWAVVHENWKFVANHDLSHIELYDIAADVAEANDLKAEKPEVAAGLQAKLEEWRSTLPEKPTGNVFSELRKENGGKQSR